MSQAVAFSESPMAKRVPLAEQVPLEKPFAVRISPSCICNFRCEFCSQAIPEVREQFRNEGTKGLMEFSLFQKVIDDIADSFGRIKQLLLVGRGEPLLHPQIADMVAYVTERQVADRVEIVTNGMLLTHELSDKLIDAGLKRLRISVDGLSSEDYMRYCGVKMDFEQFVEQIQYFYAHKKETSVYIKIINYMVSQPEQRKKFYDIFESICDIINVENLTDLHNGIDYHKIAGDSVPLVGTQFTPKYVETKICSQPFYILQVQEGGEVLPCCGPALPPKELILGNVRERSLKKIWFDRSYALQRRLLDGVKGIPFCENCQDMPNRVLPEDVLDESAERLKEKYRQIAT